jgi:hypothetical protein
MLSFPIADKQDLYGVINLNTTSIKTFSEDEIYYVSIIANLILTAKNCDKNFQSHVDLTAENSMIEFFQDSKSWSFACQITRNGYCL